MYEQLKQVGLKYNQRSFGIRQALLLHMGIIQDSHKLKQSRIGEQKQKYNFGWPYVISCRFTDYCLQ